MSTNFHAWCDTDEEGGPTLRRGAGASTLLDPDAWSAWLNEHAYHDLSLVVENSSAFGLPFFQARRGGIRFEVRTEDDILVALAWADYRVEFGINPSKEARVREYEVFKAGWAAAKGGEPTDG